VRRTVSLVALVALVSLACGRMPGNEKEKYVATDSDTVDTVLTAVLERLGTEYAERGPEFVRRVPQVKQEVAVANGFANWWEFTERVRLLSTERNLWVSRQITSRMEELLSTPYQPAEEPREPEDEE